MVILKNKETYFVKRLIEEVGHRHLQFFNPWEESPKAWTGNVLVRATGVYRDDKDLEFLRQLPHAHIINPLSSLEIFRQKKSQYVFFKNHRLGHLPWFDLSEGRPESLPPKFLVKPNRGQGGWGIEVMGPQDFEEWWQRGDHDFVLQPYIEGAQELRVFFIKDRTFLTLERKGVGVAANFKQNGSAILTELPRSAKDEVERLISLSGAIYGAIDLFLIEGRATFLELNVVPGIEQLEQVTGSNVMKLLVPSFFVN